MIDESPPVSCSAGIAILHGPELDAEGWVRRTVTDQARIDELIEVYSDLGFETRVTGLDPDSFGEACTTCSMSACRSYLALFTRSRGSTR